MNWSIFLTGLYSPGIFTLYLLLICIQPLIPTKLFHSLDEKLYSIYQRFFLLICDKFGKRKIFIHGDVDALRRSNRENAVCFSNHQTAFDWIVADILIARQGQVGRLRFVLKHVLKYIPFFGLCTYIHSFVYVNRSQFNENSAVKTLRYLRENAMQYWLIIYPEGTRYNPKATKDNNQSREFAKDQGLVPLLYHLTPRVKGFQLALVHLQSSLDAIYDLTYVYADKNGIPLSKDISSPSVSAWIEQDFTLHVHLERIPIDAVPRESSELRSWLHDRFVRKDKLFDALKKNEQGLVNRGHVDKIFERYLKASHPDESVARDGLLNSLTWTETLGAFLFACATSMWPLVFGFKVYLAFTLVVYCLGGLGVVFVHFALD